MDLSTISESEECNQDSSATLDRDHKSGHDRFPVDETQTDDHVAPDTDDTYGSKYETGKDNSEPAPIDMTASEEREDHRINRPTTPDSSLPQEHATPPSPETTPRTSKRLKYEQERGYDRQHHPTIAVTYLEDADIIAPFAPVRDAQGKGGMVDEERAFHLTGLTHGNQDGLPIASGRRSPLDPSSQDRSSKPSIRVRALSKAAATADMDKDRVDVPTSAWPLSTSESETEGDNEDDNERNEQMASDDTRDATEESKSASIDVQNRFSSQPIVTQSLIPANLALSTMASEPEEAPPTSSVSDLEGNLEDGTPKDENIDTLKTDQLVNNDPSSCIDNSNTPVSNESLPVHQPPSIENLDQIVIKTPEAAQRTSEQELVELEKETGMSRIDAEAFLKPFYSLGSPNEDPIERLAMQRTRLNFEADARACEEERSGVKSPYKSSPLVDDPDRRAIFEKSVAFRLFEERNVALKECNDALEDLAKVLALAQSSEDELSKRKSKLQLLERDLIELEKERDKLRHDSVRMKDSLRILKENDRKRQAKDAKLNKYTDELQDRNEALESEKESLHKHIKELERTINEKKDQLQGVQGKHQSAEHIIGGLKVMLRKETCDRRGLEQMLQQERSVFRKTLQEKNREFERLEFESREEQAKLEQESSTFRRKLQEKDNALRLLQHRLQNAIAVSNAIRTENQRTSTAPAKVPFVAGDSTASAPPVQPCEQPKSSLLAENRQWQERISGWRRASAWHEMREALRRQREEEDRREVAGRT